jgi:quinol monooxygenase YgiN
MPDLEDGIKPSSVSPSSNMKPEGDYRGRATMFAVIATLIAQPGKEDVVRQALLGLVPLTRQEAGCIEYHLHECLGQTGRFVFYELWKTKEDWEKHLQMPYMQQALGAAAELFANEIELDKVQFEMLSEPTRPMD